MKNQILQLLKNPPEEKSEFFNEALLLFARSSNVPQHQLRHFNANGFSNARLESLIYELKKLHGISDADVLLYEPEVSDVPAKNISMDEAEQAAPLQQLIADAEKEAAAETAVVNFFLEVPDAVKEEIKLRDEFPFLNDINCPDEIKVLVSDKLTHYHAFIDSHRQLLAVVKVEGGEPVALSDSEIFELAKAAVNNFTANQDIYAELEAYKNTGKVLGQHPKLRRLKMIQSLETATPAALAKRQSNLQNYINRETAKLSKITDPEEKLKLEKKIEGYKEEQELVKEKLGPNGNKE